MGCNGIDVSNNNGSLSLAKGFSGLDFVIAKCTEGINFTDGTYVYYMHQAAQLGILFGAYHFGHPETRQGQAEAEYFMKHAWPQSARSLWYDYEPGPDGIWPGEAAADAAQITGFIHAIKATYPHARVGLYSTRTGFERVLREVPADATWLADYNGQPETPGGPMPHGYAWDVHQYETFAGIDRDYARWTTGQMRAFFGDWPAA